MSNDRNPAPVGVEDFVRAGGYLMLGTRLKRLGDRLQADVQRLCRSDGIDVPSGLMPVLAVLHERGTLAVSDIARAIGIAH